ncbi:MAG: leucine-rich repeat protein [Clostridia bacterium]|nr:leucine-rich repeat protein [Clostridia bacterium]
MKQLICELCEGHDFQKVDGFFVCQSCGMKYSLEEAKKLMADTDSPTATTTPAPAKKAATPSNKEIIGNYLHLASVAIISNDFAEAELYASKVLEIQPTSAEAWFIKGKAAGWQSTLANLRFAETISSFVEASINTPASEQPVLHKKMGDEIKSLALSLIQTRMDHFVSWPNKDTVSSAINDIQTIIDTIKILKTSGIFFDITANFKPLPALIRQGTIKALDKTILPDYQCPYPTKYQFDEYISRIKLCIFLTESSIRIFESFMSPDDIIEQHKLLITLYDYFKNAKAYDWNYVSGVRSYYVCTSVKSEVIAEYNKKKCTSENVISKLTREIEEQKRQEEAKKRREEEEKRRREEQIKQQKESKEFWDSHSKEVEKLNEALKQARSIQTQLQYSSTPDEMKRRILNAYIENINKLLKTSVITSAFKTEFASCVQNIDTFFVQLHSMTKVEEQLQIALKKAREMQESTQLGPMRTNLLKSFIEKIEDLLYSRSHTGPFTLDEKSFLDSVDTFFEKMDEIGETEDLLQSALCKAKEIQHSAKTGLTQEKSLTQFITKVEFILNTNRSDPSITRSEIAFVQNINAFFEKLNIDAEYDDYIKKFDLIKKSEHLEKQRRELLSTLHEVAAYKKKKEERVSTIVGLFIILALFSFSSFIMALSEGWGAVLFVVSIVIGVIIFIAKVKFKSFKRKKSWNGIMKKILTFNRAVQDLNDIPPFELEIENSRKIKIPEMIPQSFVDSVFGKKAKQVTPKPVAKKTQPILTESESHPSTPMQTSTTKQELETEMQPTTIKSQEPIETPQVSSLVADAAPLQNTQAMQLENGVLTIGGFDAVSLRSIQEITVKIKIEKNVKTIPISSFSYWSKLTSVSVGENLETISSFAFFSCKKLKTVKLYRSTKCIMESAFKHCESLSDIYYDGTKKEWLAIEKGAEWDAGTGDYTVHCSDDVFKKGN